MAVLECVTQAVNATLIPLCRRTDAHFPSALSTLTVTVYRHTQIIPSLLDFDQIIQVLVQAV